MKNLYLIIFSLIFYYSYPQYEGFSQLGWEKQLEIEESFQGLIDKTSFKKHLIKLTERPHVVGSEGNEEVIRYIGKVMKEAGLKITNYPYDVYLPNKPGSSLVEIVTPSRKVLNQKEDIIYDDPLLKTLSYGKDGMHSQVVEMLQQKLFMLIMVLRKTLRL